MPELPEVETVARQLAPLVVGRRLKCAHCLDAKLDADWWPALAGCRIGEVRRLGKRVLLHLVPRHGPQLYLAVHLRMTGRLVHQSTSALSGEPARRHLRAWFSLDRGALALFDTRRFATLDVSTDLSALAPAGLDPTSRDLTPARLSLLLDGSPQPLKTWLLRQDKLVGIGNIYASEILFAAGLHPERAAGSLAAQEVAGLTRAIKRILAAAIRHCGTTFRDFQDAHGTTGGYAKYLKVYQRAGQPCLTCGAILERQVQAQRSTFYCPACQR